METLGYIVVGILSAGVIGFSIAFCVCAEKLMREEEGKTR